MKLHDLLEMTLPSEHEPHNDYRKWTEDATKWTGERPTGHLVHHKGELVARWHSSTNTGWVTKKPVNETINQDPDTFEQWQHECKQVDPNVTFVGSKDNGVQAINRINAGNKLIGQWDKNQIGVVYPPPKRRMGESVDVVDFKRQLKQAQADYDELPKNPGNQAGYDALDELRYKIQQLKHQLRKN